LASCETHQGELAVEFDANEFAERIAQGTEETFWWHQFVTDSRKRSGLKDKFAIVTGLMGLDSEHHGHAELHPTWVLSAGVEEEGKGGNLDEVWAIFARKWGDEGFCSRMQHYMDLPDQKFTLRLPWRNTTGDPKVLEETKFCGTSNIVKP